MCVENFSSQKVERHNKPEVEIQQSYVILFKAKQFQRDDRRDAMKISLSLLLALLLFNKTEAADTVAGDVSMENVDVELNKAAESNLDLKK